MPHGRIIRAMARALSRSTRDAQKWRTLKIASQATERALNEVGRLNAARISGNQALHFGFLEDLAQEQSEAMRFDLLAEIRDVEQEIRKVFPQVAQTLRERGQSIAGGILRQNTRIGSVMGDALLSFRLAPEGEPFVIQDLQRAIKQASRADEALPTIVVTAESTIIPRQVTAFKAKEAVNLMNQLARNAEKALTEADAITRRGSLVEVQGNVGRIEQAIAPVPSPFTPPAELKLQQLEAVKQARAEITRQLGPKR